MPGPEKRPAQERARLRLRWINSARGNWVNNWVMLAAVAGVETAIEKTSLPNYVRKLRFGFKLFAHRYTSTAPRRRTNLDLIHKALHDGKTEPRPFIWVTGRIQRLHGLAYIRDADAAIRDGNTHHSAF